MNKSKYRSTTSYKPDEMCFYCTHAYEVHTEPGSYCAVCKANENGMPPLPGIARPCTTFRRTEFCGDCGARMAWFQGMGYCHANPEFDEHHQPYRRKSRVQQV